MSKSLLLKTQFIGQYYLEDLSICEKLIDYFNNNKSKQHLGLIGNGEVDLNIKKSTDISIFPSEFFIEENSVILDYLKHLRKCIDLYIEDYPDCNEYSAWAIKEGINLRKYKPGEGFTSWHTERCSNSINVQDRHIAFMTYLNDVTDGGGTEFKNQNIIIQPEKGKTLIWPTDWTHTHRGIASKTQSKYIITGWFSYT